MLRGVGRRGGSYDAEGNRAVANNKNGFIWDACRRKGVSYRTYGEFADNYNRGDKVGGQIRSITDFGLFIGLEGDIDGLVHHSDISWSETGETAIKAFKKGDHVEGIPAGGRGSGWAASLPWSR